MGPRARDGGPVGDRYAFDAIGTRWWIDTPRPLEGPLRARIGATIEAFDRTWSRFRSDSLVMQLATYPGSYDIGEQGRRLIELYERLHAVTDGAVTPLVATALEDLGYDRTYRLRPRRSPAGALKLTPVPTWEDVLSRRGTWLTLHRPALLDVGAAGKGYLVDLVAADLVAAGVEAFTVDAGGDLLHRGPQPLRVALEHPDDPTRAIGVVELGDGALCASATGRRRWPGGDDGADLHHVLDGRTGLPTRDVVATWAMAPTALLADGLATALFFAPGPRVREAFAADAPGALHYVQVTAEGAAYSDPSLPGEVFR